MGESSVANSWYGLVPPNYRKRLFSAKNTALALCRQSRGLPLLRYYGTGDGFRKPLGVARNSAYSISKGGLPVCR